MMYDWLYSSHGCLFWRRLHWGIARSSWWWSCEMTVYVRHILPRVYLALRTCPFWDDAFILGAYLPCWFWHWDSTSCLWSLLSMDYSHWHPGFNLLDVLGPTWVPTFLCYTSIHPTLDSVIPALILSEPYIFWAHIFHHLTWPYPLVLIRGRYGLVLSFLVEFSRTFGH